MDMTVKKAHLIRWLLVVGALLAVFGFYLDHSEQNEWIVDRFARSYVRAMSAYEKMLNSDSGIGPADTGFTEIASICSEKLSGPDDLTIVRIGVREGDSLRFKGKAITEDFILEITLQDGRSATGNIEDLRPQIRQRFLGDVLFRWSQLFFWLGVGLILLEHFVIDRFSPGDS